MNNLKPVNILEPWGSGGQCLAPAEEEGGPEGFPNLLQEEEQEEDQEEKKEDDDKE